MIKKKDKLINELINLQSMLDPETSHKLADKLLLRYIGDDKITDAFNKIKRWYS